MHGSSSFLESGKILWNQKSRDDSERYCDYYYYYFGKKRDNVKTEHIVNKLKENRLKKDKLKEIQGWKLYNHTSRRIKIKE